MGSRRKALDGAGCRRSRQKERRLARQKRLGCGQTGWRQRRRRSQRKGKEERGRGEEFLWKGFGPLTLLSTSYQTMTGSVKHGASTSPTMMSMSFRRDLRLTWQNMCPTTSQQSSKQQ